MKKWLKFDQTEIVTVGIGPFMAVIYFLAVMIIEILFGLVVYFFCTLVKDQTVLSSVILNLGTLISKGLTLYLMIHLMTLPKEKLGPVSSIPNFKFDTPNLLKGRGLQFTLLIFGIFLAFRTAYDPLTMPLVIDHFGIDQDMVEGFKQILGFPLLGLLYICVIAPIYEELIFRGLIFGGMLRKGWGYWPAALTSSLLFALMHLNWAQGFNAFCIGMIAAALYYLTGDLRVSIGLHIVNNSFVDLLSFATTELYAKLSTPYLALISIMGLLGLLACLISVYQISKKAADV